MTNYQSRSTLCIWELTSKCFYFLQRIFIKISKTFFCPFPLLEISFFYFIYVLVIHISRFNSSIRDKMLSFTFSSPKLLEKAKMKFLLNWLHLYRNEEKKNFFLERTSPAWWGKCALWDGERTTALYNFVNMDLGGFCKLKHNKIGPLSPLGC